MPGSDRKTDLSGTFVISVGRKKHLVEIKELYPDGRIKTLVINNKVYPVQVLRRADGLPNKVFLQGIGYDVEIEKIKSTRYRPPTTKKKICGEIKSSLPGQIQTILVQEGDTVEVGEPVIILESMKMENEILAPKKGIVRKIDVTVGELVLKGQIMIEII